MKTNIGKITVIINSSYIDFYDDMYGNTYSVMIPFTVELWYNNKEIKEKNLSHWQKVKLNKIFKSLEKNTEKQRNNNIKKAFMFY